MSALFQYPKAVPLNTDGIIIPGARLYFYDAGTTNAQTVYQNAGLSVAHAQPVEADSAGMFPLIYLTTGTFKIILKTAADVTLDTADYLDSGLPAGSGVLPVASGGTGASDAAAARTALGAASASALSALSASLGLLAVKSTIDRTTDLAAGFGDITLQRVLVDSTTSVVTCSGAIPNDNTIPQVGEGTQVLSGNFTPKSASSILFVEAQVRGGAGAASIPVSALFTGASVSAIHATRCQVSAQHMGATLDFVHRMASPGTNQITFSVRAGPNTGSFYVNGDGSGTAYLGGVMKAHLIITEILTV